MPENIVLAWQVFLQEMHDIEVGAPFALQILREAKRSAEREGITLEEMIEHAQAKWEERAAIG